VELEVAPLSRGSRQVFQEEVIFDARLVGQMAKRIAVALMASLVVGLIAIVGPLNVDASSKVLKTFTTSGAPSVTLLAAPPKACSRSFSVPRGLAATRADLVGACSAI
jgi:hypothetical protein